MTKQEMFMRWINDAYAMEQSASDLLSRYGKDLDDYPAVRDKFFELSDSAKEKTDQLGSAIERLGGDPSAIKSTMGLLGSMTQSAASEFMHDQVVKHMLVTASGAALAAASYVSLSAAAKEIGDQDTASMADQYAQKAKDAEAWLLDHTPEVTQKFLNEEHKS